MDSTTNLPPLPEPAAHMYPSDLEKFKTSETFAEAFSVAVGNPDERSVPLVTLSDCLEYAALAQSAQASDKRLLDLLAVIHRDGGHYVEEHGLEKGYDDARNIVAALVQSEQAPAQPAPSVEDVTRQKVDLKPDGSVRRYSWDWDTGTLFESQNGRWVRLADHRAALRTAVEALARSKA